MRTATSDVRYTPNNNCKNGLPQKVMSALPPIVLQNYFEGAAHAALIQDQTKMSNIDSPRHRAGFDCCAIAMRQRVLQHIPPKSGRVQRKPSFLLWAKSGHDKSYSITLSASESIAGGTVTPIALAVLRLTASSNVVGNSTGKSAGLAPFRILST